MSLLYFSPVPWNSFSQRPHYFVKWYRQRFGSQVIWIDPYASRFPKFDDLSRLKRATQDWQGECPAWLKIIRPKLLPIEPIEQLAWINRWLWRRQIKSPGSLKLFERHEGSWKIVVGKPSDIALSTVIDFKPVFCLCDFMDDVSEFHAGRAQKRVLRVESSLLKHMHAVWASSHVLYEKFCHRHRHVTYVPNALELSTVAKNIDSHADFHGQPVAGYVGTIGAWFDWDWLIRLATLMLGYSIELIGPIHTEIPHQLPANVVLLGALPHARAISHMRTFKLALIPFKSNRLTQSVDPIKYYEYKALGLPILSTEFGEMSHHKHAGGVFICDDESSMKTAIQLAKEYQTTSLETHSFIEANHWTQRFDAAFQKMPMGFGS